MNRKTSERFNSGTKGDQSAMTETPPLTDAELEAIDRFLRISEIDPSVPLVGSDGQPFGCVAHEPKDEAKADGAVR